MLISLNVIDHDATSACIEIIQDMPETDSLGPLMFVSFDMSAETHKVTISDVVPGASHQVQSRAVAAASDLVSALFAKERMIDVVEI